MGRFRFVKDPVSGKMMFVDTGDKSSVKPLAKNGNSFVIGGPSSMYKTSFNSAQSLHAIKLAKEKEEKKRLMTKTEQEIRAEKAWSVYQQTGLKPIIEDPKVKDSEEDPKDNSEKGRKKVSQKKVGASFSKFVTGMTDKELQSSSYVEEFLAENKDLGTSLDNLLLYHIKEGMTDEQYFKVVLTSSRDNSAGLTETIKRNGGKYPSELHLSKNSSKVSSQKEELSLRALKAFATAKRDNMRKTDFVREGAAYGLYDEDTAKSIVSRRDFYRILLKPGIDPETVSENKRRLDYYICKNLDKNKYTEAEYRDLLKRQKAEILNKRLEELASADYSKFEHMDDETLVEKWVEYAGYMDAISVFSKESKDYANGQNPYVNQELLRKVNEIEYKYNPAFIRNSGRIRAIANPYYSKYDFKGFDKLSPVEIGSINDGRLSGNANLTNLFTELNVWHTGNVNVFLHGVVSDMRKNLGGVLREDIRFFDAKGKALIDSNDIYMAAKKGTVFAAPKDRPDMLKPYSYDSKLMDHRPLDPAPYTRIMKKIRSDITKTLEAEDKILDQDGDFKDFLSDTKSLRSHIVTLASQINNAEKPGQMKEMMMSALKRKCAPLHPKVGYDEYAKIIGLKKSEMLSPEIVEERRQLTERAMTGMLELQLNAPKVSEQSIQLIGSGGSNVRHFSAFMLKPGDSADTNNKTVKAFFNGDAKTKKKMILERVAEYKSMINSMYGKNFTDSEIVDNMNTIHSVATGMGMEFIGAVKNNIKQWGLDFSQEELDMMTDLNEKASTINDLLIGRLNMIATPHYQFGALEKLDYGENSKKYSKFTTDTMFNKSADTVSNEYSFVNLAKGRTLLKLADPSGKKKLEGAFDEKGNYISADNIQGIGKIGFESGRIFLFYEGEKEPVALDCKNPNSVPPEVAAAKEISPEMRAQFGNMRRDITINAIDANRRLAPGMKELEKSIISKGYELEMMSESLNASPKNRDVFKRKMAEYLASLTIRQMVEKSSKNLDKDTLARLTSAESVKRLSSDLRKSPVTDLVIDTMLKDPNGFKDIDSRAVYNTMLNQMGTADRIAEERKKEVQKAKNAEAAQSIKTISENKKILLSDEGANSKEFFGLNKEILAAVKSQTNMQLLTIDRSSIQAQAFSILLEQGYTVDEALEDSPQMQNARRNAAKQAIAETVGNKAESVRRHLQNGQAQIDKYISSKIRGMKNLSVAELAKPEYKNFRKLSPLLKDISQELINVNKHYVPEEKRWSPEKVAGCLQINDFASKVLATSVYAVEKPLHEMVSEGQNFDPCNNIKSYMHEYIRGMLGFEAARSASELPENQGKPVEKVWGENTFKATVLGAINLDQDKNFADFVEKCQNNKALANKVYRSILDDSLRKDLDMKIVYKQNGESELHVDTKRFIKAMNEKLGVDIPDSLNKLENGLQHKQEEKAPVENGPKIPQ